MNTSHIILWLTAIIWGAAFVAQSEASQLLGSHSFNATRFILAIITLSPLLYFFPSKQDYPYRTLILGGMLAGTCLFIAFSFQQSGLNYVTAGEAGFISSTYIVIVPILGMAIGQQTSRYTWLGIFFALTGLYQLSVGPNFSINYGNTLELAGAFFWAFHVLIIGYLSTRLPAIPLVVTQFTMAAILSTLCALIFEDPKLSNFTNEWLPILYAGIVASGIARTLQIIGQRKVAPSTCALILSTEALFAVIADWLFLGVSLSFEAYLGSGLILIGMLISLWPKPSTTNSTESKKLS